MWNFIRKNEEYIYNNVSKTISAMRQDKKNLGKGLALVMLKDNYEMIKITDLQEGEAWQLLENVKD